MGMNTSVATKEHITRLSGMLGQKDVISGETCAGADFQQAAYEVLYKCVGSIRKVLEHNQSKIQECKTVTPATDKWKSHAF